MLRIMRVFPDAQWEEEESLPTYITRRAEYKDGQNIYDSRYLMAGCYKLIKKEHLGHGVWNEQLAPWPWFLALTLLPSDISDFVAMFDLGIEEFPYDPDFYYLIYADGNGAIPLRIAKENSRELFMGFKELWSSPVKPGPPQIVRSSWDIRNKKLNKILRRGSVENATEHFVRLLATIGENMEGS